MPSKHAMNTLIVIAERRVTKASAHGRVVGALSVASTNRPALDLYDQWPFRQRGATEEVFRSCPFVRDGHPLADSDDRAPVRPGSMRVRLPLLVLSSTAALALGCGSGGSSGFDDNGGPSSTGPDHGGPSTDLPDATLSGGETDAQLFVPGATVDAGVVTQAGACTAGVYKGMFMTYVGAGADGGAPGPFSFMWNGSLTIDLTAQKVTMTSTTVGELPTTTTTSTLELAEGGAIDGGDPYGGSLYATLSGRLDCAPDAGPPYRLIASFSDGTYKQSTFFSIVLTGHLSADYQAGDGGTPPMLVNGQILFAGIFTDGGTPPASASGTWTATWVSPN
jgi:hypothetical protein